MGTMKKYDYDSKSWKTLSTTDASEIVSRSTKLSEYLKNGKAEVSTQEVLEKMADDISLAKSNISWLAKFGGGGSGGSGGGGAVATGTIIVKNSSTEYLTNSTIIRKDDERLSFRLQQDVTMTWNYIVTFENKVLSVGTISDPNKEIKIADINTLLQYNSANQGSLNITCSCGLSNVYWNGTIVLNQLTLSADEAKFAASDLEGKTITYRYSSSTTGEYKITITGKTGSYTDIISIKESGNIYTLNVNVLDLYDAKSVGSNTTTAILEKVDKSVSTQITHQVVITSDNIIISSNSLSSMSDSPTQHPKSANIKLEFTAYLTVLGASFMYYRIYYKPQNSSDKIELIGKTNGYLNQPMIVYVPTSLDEIIVGETGQIIIEVFTDSGKSAEQSYYIKWISSNIIKLDIPKTSKLASDFIAFQKTGQEWESSLNEFEAEQGNATTVTQSVEIFNKNVLSGIQSSDDDATCFRLSNKAFGVVSNFDVGGYSKSFYDLFSQHRNFTISVSFKADYHVGDDHVILQLGQFKTNLDKYEFAHGILIKAHEIIIRTSSGKELLVELQDQELYNIDIVYQSDLIDEWQGVKVYVNGVISKASSDIDFLETKDGFIGTNIYLCAANYNGIWFNYADCNFYRLMIYFAYLNDYEILMNHLQNRAYTHFVDGLPNNEEIEDGAKRNFLELKEGKIDKSWFWQSGYSLSNFIINELVDGSKYRARINPDIGNYGLPIPLLFIDLSSNDSWTWDNFISTDENIKLNTSYSVPFEYYDPKGTSIQEDSKLPIVRGECNISIQGTSSKNYAIKNLTFDLTVPNSNKTNIFIPKAHWMPEKAYTLKADIVDSSHSLNASIGRFINEKLAGGDSPFIATDEYIETAFKSTNYYQNCEQKPTLKMAVEGFPVFVIIRFYSEDALTLDVRSLGLYQFVLGRDSVYNLGMSILNDIKYENTSLQPINFPYYYSQAVIEDTTSQAYWVEANATYNNRDALTLDAPDAPQWNSNPWFTALCWQFNTKTLNNQFSVKNIPDIQASDVPRFQKLIESIARCPITLRTKYSSEYKGGQRENYTSGYAQAEHIDGENYDLIYNSDGTISTVEMNTTSDGIEIDRYLNLDQAYKYFNIELLFGLLDNFCKNMPFILHNYSEDSKFRLGFYDMDSGLGGDNQGQMYIEPYLYFKHLKNDGLFVQESYDAGQYDMISGYDNKLWLSLEHFLVAGKQGIRDTDNPYTVYWKRLRKHISDIQIDESQVVGNNFVDYFMNEYFIPQTEGCGELLFNLTYTVKYINTGQASFLHGTRIQQVRRWLKEHIDFLDSIAVFKKSEAVLESNSSPIQIYSLDKYTTIPAKYNQSLIVTTTNQGGEYTYMTFCKKNEETELQYGGGSAQAQNIAKTLNWSNNLLSLGNNKHPLGLSGFSQFGSGSLYGFNILDLNGCKTMSSTDSIKINTIFYNNGSELREINLSNTSNYGNKASITLDLTKFQKITDINIENGCVSSIDLPNTPLTSLNIKGSRIDILSISNQNLLTSLDVTGCNQLTDIIIDSCATMTKIVGINTLENLRTIAIKNCPITSLDITNCKELASVELSVETLDNLNISNCVKFTKLNISGSWKISELNISGCVVFDTLSINSLHTNLTRLSLRDSKIQTIKIDESSKSLLDLSQFEDLKYFDIAYNDAVKEIQFSNKFDKQIELANKFTNCTSLERIYGHIKITNKGIFNGCTNFKLHGDRFHGEGVVDDNGKYLMPYEILGCTLDEYTNKTDNKWFDDTHTHVTNLQLECESAELLFAGTSASQFDVYYIFSNPGVAKDFTSTFAGLKNKIFNWTEKADNSPNRFLFKNCSQIKSLYKCFDNSCGYHRIFSPYIDEHDGTFIQGLFTPLTSTTSFSWYNTDKFIIDRKVFWQESNKFNWDTISHFNPYLIVDDINKFEYLDLSNISSIIMNNYDGEEINLGNVNQIFKDANFQTAYGICRTNFINYKFITKKLLPDNCTTIRGSFVCNFAHGELNLNLLIPTNIEHIYQSYMYNSSSLDDIDISFVKNYFIATMNLSNDTFKMMSNLKSIGYINSGDYAGNELEYSFKGVKKTIVSSNGKFPYEMFYNNKNLVMCSGLFRDAECDADNIQLPGALFKNCPKLTNVASLFYNFNSPYTLTSEGFAKCTGLNNVSYLFAQDSDRTVWNLSGSIPSKLFYHGHTVNTKYIQGSTRDITYDEDNNPIYPEIETVSFSYNNMNRSIAKMDYCFKRCNIDIFKEASTEIENNVDYIPEEFNLLYDSATGAWSKITNWPKEKTAIWIYNGTKEHKEELLKDTSVELIDDSIGDSVLVVNDVDTYITDAYTFEHNFMCAPDLLRYCKNNASIVGLFAYSGTSGHTAEYNTDLNNEATSVYGVGITGRICPYLLKPVYNTTNLSYIFTNCKRLTMYSNLDESRYYTIPLTFLSYVPNVTDLSYAFSGMMFHAKTDLNIFTYNRTMDVKYMFYKPYFYGTSAERTTVGNIFSGKNITNLSHIFALCEENNQNSANNNIKKNQYITFDGVFGNANITKGVYDKNKYRADYAFAGYKKDHVIFENKTFIDEPRSNYWTTE